MIIQEEMYIRSLKRTRKIDIYVPDDYQTSKKRYPVLIIMMDKMLFLMSNLI